MPATLAPIDGLPVVRTTVKLVNAGDGLSKSMRIDPAELHQGDRVFILSEGVVQKLQAEPIDPDVPGGDQTRVHIVKCETMMLVDREFAADRVEAQKAKLRQAADEAAGREPLPDVGTVRVGAAENHEGFYDPALEADGQQPDTSAHPAAQPRKRGGRKGSNPLAAVKPAGETDAPQ